MDYGLYVPAAIDGHDSCAVLEFGIGPAAKSLGAIIRWEAASGPEIAKSLWEDKLNDELDQTGLTTQELIAEANRRGADVCQLLAGAPTPSTPTRVGSRAGRSAPC